ncbi:MAG: cell division protein FtsZ, partial [Bacteroidota bacterium]
MNAGAYRFDLPTHHRSIIKVMGVGGGGSNAVNNMYSRGIKDVSFVICNTDAQALENSPIQNKLQLGMNLTGGLGAGASP